MNVERLKLLADFLRNDVPQRNFNLGSWRSGRDMTDEALLAHCCCTTACAVGWACAMPEFIAQGLYSRNGQPAYRPLDTPEDVATVLFSWEATEMFFDLNYDQACALFSGDSYHEGAEPTDVANRIELFTRDQDEAIEEANQCELDNRWSSDEIDGNEEEPEEEPEEAEEEEL